MAKGRPSKYTKAVALEVCKWISEGKSLRSFCEQEKKPSISTIVAWIFDGKHKDFSEQYALARKAQAEVLQDECLNIADDGKNDTYVDEKGNTRTDWDVVGRSKLRIDTRKWILERMTSKAPEALQNQPVVLNFVSDPKPERYAKPEADKNGTKDK